jgi:hypothetical protein
MTELMSIEELLSEESPELRAKITARGKELIKAETLRQLRSLARKKQGEIAGMKQDGVSRLERRSDMLLSSLNTYVRGLGGTLKIVADLPDIGRVDLELTRQARVKAAPIAKAIRSRPRAAAPLQQRKRSSKRPG